MKTTTLLLALVPALFLTSCYVTPAGGPYNNNRGGYRAPAPRPGGSHHDRGHDHDRDRRDNDRDRRDNDRDRRDNDRDRRDNDRDRYDRDGDRDGRGSSGTFRRSSSRRSDNPVFPYGA